MHQREKLLLIQCHSFQIHEHAATCPQKRIHCWCPRMICHQRENKRWSSAILFFINSSPPLYHHHLIACLSLMLFLTSCLSLSLYLCFSSPSCPMSKLSPLFLASCQVASSRWVELHSWQRLSELSQCRHCAQTSRTHSREREKNSWPCSFYQGELEQSLSGSTRAEERGAHIHFHCAVKVYISASVHATR